MVSDWNLFEIPEESEIEGDTILIEKATAEENENSGYLGNLLDTKVLEKSEEEVIEPAEDTKFRLSSLEESIL